ncbi:MAG: nucleotidyl transferase AbiEii/AbiGii toxin family protein [Candidatus Pacebacteria bacterium]|nr:nucleotidyl transferase AbiEii/AbiGii toxin family protein [Candidatus Paceibacterota bacterium]MDD5752803.1 nucleotidyl transferase AbiEii/AbiGii toxin family protein [Candidatus Paceibacterota bacterium]
MKEILKNIVLEKRKEGIPDFVIRNYLKEYLQYPVLEFIYSNRKYKRFIFTGGSCLRICFNAPRLSEDLDFDLDKKEWEKLDISKVAKEIEEYFKKEYLLDVKTKCQGKGRIYLKFQILKDLGLSNKSESDWLYVKIEPTQTIFKEPETELSPISQYGFNFIIKNYSLEFLMTGKLCAIFTRKWFKGDEQEINIKGRDFYDLFWYLQKGVSPNFNNLKKIIGIGDWEDLKKELKKRIEENVTSQKLGYDLKNFFPDQKFVSDFCKNYKKIIFQYL